MAKSLGILAPGFLIASPPLGDPNFDRTVVLLAIHGDGGALGFVVNRAAPLNLGELLKAAGYGEQGAGNASTVYVGGPVQPSSGGSSASIPRSRPTTAGSSSSGIASASPRPGARSIRWRATSRRRSPAPSIRGGAPCPRLQRLGPGQLEGEIAAGSWLPCRSTRACSSTWTWRIAGSRPMRSSGSAQPR